MTGELVILLLTAAWLGFLHTLLGPDHYLPFVMMARARGWRWRKTAAITAVCGAGHIVGSIALGLLGIALGLAVSRLEAVESVRGSVAAWGLIGFGALYGAWGLRSALRARPHGHVHDHGGLWHTHEHVHTGEHAHVHDEEGQGARLTPWVLFVVFVLGPCEPLIPLLMYPAAKSHAAAALLVALVFGGVTVLTMVGATAALMLGVRRIRLGLLERYTHALAGAGICLCGVAVEFMGL